LGWKDNDKALDRKGIARYQSSGRVKKKGAQGRGRRENDQNQSGGDSKKKKKGGGNRLTKKLTMFGGGTFPRFEACPSKNHEQWALPLEWAGRSVKREKKKKDVHVCTQRF